MSLLRGLSDRNREALISFRNLVFEKYLGHSAADDPQKIMEEKPKKIVENQFSQNPNITNGVALIIGLVALKLITNGGSVIFFAIMVFIILKGLYDSDGSEKTVSQQTPTGLKSNLDKSQFIRIDPDLLKWAGETIIFKQYNVVEYNKLIQELDRFMSLTDKVLKGFIGQRRHPILENIDDSRKRAINIFHSLIYSIPNIDSLMDPFNEQLQVLCRILDTRIQIVIKSLKHVEYNGPMEQNTLVTAGCYDPFTPQPYDLLTSDHDLM